MSMENVKIKCSVCDAYLFEDDDVVYCPDCGAPHHRECYNRLGHCAFADRHGTDEEYKKPETEIKTENAIPHENTAEGNYIKCGMCGQMYDREEKNCPNCGTPDMSRNRFMMGFDFLGGVPADLDLGEGVTADEAKRFVLANTQRYIPKFARNKVGKRTSWNWIAFLFPPAWFLSRKMYKEGIFTGALSVAFTLLGFPFINVINSFSPDMTAGYSQFYTLIAENISKIGVPAIICAAAGLVLDLVLRIICGMFGDLFYRNYCISAIKKIKTDSDDIEEDFRKKGGVNFLLFLVGFFAVENLPAIIAMLAGF